MRDDYWKGKVDRGRPNSADVAAFVGLARPPDTAGIEQQAEPNCLPVVVTATVQYACGRAKADRRLNMHTMMGQS